MLGLFRLCGLELCAPTTVYNLFAVEEGIVDSTVGVSIAVISAASNLLQQDMGNFLGIWEPADHVNTRILIIRAGHSQCGFFAFFYVLHFRARVNAISVYCLARICLKP